MSGEYFQENLAYLRVEGESHLNRPLLSPLDTLYDLSGNAQEEIAAVYRDSEDKQPHLHPTSETQNAGLNVQGLLTHYVKEGERPTLNLPSNLVGQELLTTCTSGC